MADPAPPSRFVPDARVGQGADPADPCLVVAGRRLLVGADGGLPSVADLPAGTEWVPLGSLDGTRVWAAGLPAVDDQLGGWRSWPAMAGELGEPLAALAGRALQVITWRRTHRFCGACATELVEVPGEHARRCPGCDLYVPMQLSPAVLASITRSPGPDGDELLLVRHTYGPTAVWALVAGFVEAGETLEEAVHREVAEEVGLDVHKVDYFGSQPWAMSGPGVVLAGFTARAAPDAEPVVDGREIAEARWFALDDLPTELPAAYSISRWLIEHQRAGRSDRQ
ncbi:NAD(+) diphosphatase [Solwaraspora sp. WMMA2059]|uniref:NAD(+) diphosphatase n=1 Tax=Solwaraspora sp. WMMA2059 TaxID=3015160 RepID=UPI00248CB1CE|nr:NAD(+) diphosphatase [Solwaraspora sp. WMMA2059]WBB96225.1 NAD(+) diphosphatase [Solwaraspora sp. WMMA2059]